MVWSYILSFSLAFLAFGPFPKYTEACGPVILFLVFMSIFLHLLVSNRFWHFAHFRNAQSHAIRLYIFLVFMSVFDIWPILEIHRGMWSGNIFSRFHAQPQKSYQSKFQKCCPTIIKKQVKKKFSFSAIEKRLDFNKKRV